MEDVLDRIRDPESGTSPIAGGMVLVIMMKEKVVTPGTLVDISRLEELGRISYDEREGLSIGATATHLRIESSPEVAKHYPSLREAFHTIGNVRIRTVGTLGGNLAYSEPQSNPPAILAALNAQVHVRGPNGKRAIPAEDFVRGIFESALEPGELITHVTVPPPKPRSATGFRKFTTRSETDKPTVVVAVNVELDRSMKRVADCRIVVGAVGPKTYRCFEAEKMVTSAEGPGSLDFAGIAKRASKEFEVIEDANGPSWFKKQIAAVIVREVLAETVESAKREGA